MKSPIAELLWATIGCVEGRVSFLWVCISQGAIHALLKFFHYLLWSVFILVDLIVCFISLYCSIYMIFHEYSSIWFNVAIITIYLDDYTWGKGNMETIPSHKGRLVVHAMIVEQGYSIYSMKLYTLRK